MWIPAYKALMKCSAPLLEAYLRRRMRRGKEDPVRFHERLGRPVRARGAEPLVWFHAASVGESLSLLALIQKILKEHPGTEVMVTTGTVTSAKLMAERLPEGAFHQYTPVDHPVWTENFLNHWHPDFVVWSESEFWPNLLTGIRARGIPAILVNARMSEASFNKWRLVKSDIREILKTFSLCLAQNPAEAERLTVLGAVAVKVSGNLKYAALPLPYDAARLAGLQAAIGARPCLLWASTHPGEEETACRIHKEIRTEIPRLLSIIAPRHPARGKEIQELCGKADLTSGLRSERILPQEGDDVYIADTLGEMGLFYRLPAPCILGGSFVPHGGHNPIEPAQLGCQIFYGPHMFNFISICDDFESRGGTLRAKDENDLKEKLLAALKDPALFAPMAVAAKNWTEKQSHIVDEIMTDIAPYARKALTA